jgi:hypothetical protein
MFAASFRLSALVFICLYPAFAQDAAAPKEGVLNTYLAREPTDTNGQLALMQGMYQEQVDVTLVQFLLMYGSRVHMEPHFFPANTTDHEMIPGYVFTPAYMAKRAKRPGLVMVQRRLSREAGLALFQADRRGRVARLPRDLSGIPGQHRLWRDDLHQQLWGNRRRRCAGRAARNSSRVAAAVVTVSMPSPDRD